MNRISQREDGTFEWRPETPDDALASRVKVGAEWVKGPGQALIDLRRTFAFSSPIKCIGCEIEVPFLDAFNFGVKWNRTASGDRRKETIAEGSIQIGIRTRFLKESDNPAHLIKTHQGMRLHIMYWGVVPMLLKGPGCKRCQRRMLDIMGSGGTYIDLTPMLLRAAAQAQLDKVQS